MDFTDHRLDSDAMRALGRTPLEEKKPVGKPRIKFLSSVAKDKSERWPAYFSRLRYAVLRRVHPQYREQYRLEQLVGPENCWEELVQYQFNILTTMGVKPEHAVLDLGCGPLTIGLKLISYLDRGNYVGVDLRQEPLVEAYRLIAKRSLVDKNPTFIKSANFGEHEIGDRFFDFIWMSQLSCHLDDSLMLKLFEQAQRRLKPNGRLLFDVMEPERKLARDSEWSGFSFHLRPLDYYSALGRRFGFPMESHGRIVDFGYPRRFKLHTNILLDFRRDPERLKRPETIFKEALLGMGPDVRVFSGAPGANHEIWTLDANPPAHQSFAHVSNDIEKR